MLYFFYQSQDALFLLLRRAHLSREGPCGHGQDGHQLLNVLLGGLGKTNNEPSLNLQRERERERERESEREREREIEREREREKEVWEREGLVSGFAPTSSRPIEERSGWAMRVRQSVTPCKDIVQHQSM